MGGGIVLLGKAQGKGTLRYCNRTQIGYAPRVILFKVPCCHFLYPHDSLDPFSWQYPGSSLTNCVFPLFPSCRKTRETQKTITYEYPRTSQVSQTHHYRVIGTQNFYNYTPSLMYIYMSVRIFFFMFRFSKKFAKISKVN